MRAATVNGSVVVTIVLVLIAYTIGGVRWAERTNAQIEGHSDRFATLRSRIDAENEQRANQDDLLKNRIEAVKDKLEAIGSRSSRLEALQEGLMRSVDRLQNAFDAGRESERPYFQGSRK